MALMEYPIIIDGEEYLVRENAVQAYPPSFPPRILQGPTPEFTDLTIWEHDGMDTFRGGLGQKHFKDKEMFYDNVGTCTWEDDEAKLAPDVTRWKSFSDLGVDNDTPMWVIRDTADYNNCMWFSNWYGEWGSDGYGRCLIWKWDGTTLTDLRSTLRAAEIDGNYMGVGSTNPLVINIRNATGAFTAGIWCLITTKDRSGWEVVYVTDVSGNSLTVARAQPLTWDEGKTVIYPALDNIVDGSIIYELSYSAPPRMGGGVSAMCVYNSKLYIGTASGAVFMYNALTGCWYMQPAPTGKWPFTPYSYDTSLLSLDLMADAMCVFRDKLFVGIGAWLYSYDEATPDGGGVADGVTGNPWGNGFLQAVLDACSITTMVVYNYFIYFNVWSDRQRAASLYRYDGVSIYPVYTFPSPSEIRYMAVYDGRIFLGVGRYNYQKSSGVGQLWSYDGTTMRKHLSVPRNDVPPADHINYTIMHLKVINDKLYFSDSNTPGLYIYDAVYDAVHRALVAEDNFGCNQTVEGIWAWGDRVWFSVTSYGVYRTDDTMTTYSTGKAGGYFGYNYPYVQSSIFGTNLPNVDKLYYRLTLWHSPAVSGQKFRLHYSRNFMRNYSAAHEVVLKPGATITEVILMEEGTTNSLATLGGFNGTQTGEYGIKATNLSVIIAFVTTNNTTQLTLHGFVIDYLPINHKEQLTLRIAAVDNMELPSKGRVPMRGVEKLKALQAAYEACRPVRVEHFLLTRGETKVMLITDYKALIPDPNVYKYRHDTDYYGVEAECIIQLTEC